MKRKQLVVFLVMLVVYALSAFATYTFFIDELVAGLTKTLAQIFKIDIGAAEDAVALESAGSWMTLAPAALAFLQNSSTFSVYR